jgi:coproporphyrinogen III oxidase
MSFSRAIKSFTKIILLCLNLNYTKSVLTVPKLLNMQRFLEFCEFCTDAQSKIISKLENVERDLSTGSNKKFVLDPWSRGGPESSVEGEGITSVLQKGNVFEKAAVSTTFTSGILSLERAKAISGRKMDINNQSNNLVGTKYYAAALSLVLHSKSPKVPTFRSDIRYFELDDGIGWFGGGADLTPYLLFESDVFIIH